MHSGPRADVVLPPDERSPAAARRHVRAVLDEAGRDDVLDVALLLTTELVTNSVLHTGTATTVDVAPGPNVVTITVTDQSPVAHDVVRASALHDPPVHDSAPRDEALRAAVRDPAPRDEAARDRVLHDSALDDEDVLLREGGRGIQLLAALAARWGVVHTATTKSVWFDVGGSPSPPARAPRPPRTSATPPRRDVSWLTRLPDVVERNLHLDELLREIGSRLAEALDADALRVWVMSDGEWRTVVGRGVGASGPVLGGDRQRGADARPILVPDLLAAPGPFPPSLVAEGLRCALAVPILLDGTLLGCLELAAAVPAAFDEDATALARLAADRMAVAIRTRRLGEAEQRRRGFLAFLAEASELLAGTFDTDHTLAMLVQLCVPHLATTAIVQLFDQHRQPRLAALADADEARGARLRRTLTATGTQACGPIGLATQRGVVTRTTPDRLDRRLATGPGGDALTVPLTARGRTLGALCLVRVGPPCFAADDAALAEDLARRAALAVDNARLYEQVSDTVTALQRNLLPPGLPSAEGVEFGASYAVAGEGNVVGGDFYDVVRLGERRWGLAVGDVCGKGADAAAVTGLARSAFRLLAPHEGRLADVLGRLNRLLLEQGEASRFCTVAAAEIEVTPAALAVRLVSAGHPPAVLVRAGGATRFAGRLGTLIGVLDDLEVPETRLCLGRGDTLVFYTDGVTERRDDNGVMFGEDRLLRLLGSCSRMPAQAVADTLESEVRRFARSPLRDDLAVLVVQAR